MKYKITFLATLWCCIIAGTLHGAKLSGGINDFYIDDSNGRLIKIVSGKGGEWGGPVELYELRSKDSIENASELSDSVSEVNSSDKRMVYNCVNSIFPKLRISKTYTVNNDGTLSKELKFSSDTDDRLIVWNNAFELNKAMFTSNAERKTQLEMINLKATLGFNYPKKQALAVYREKVNNRDVMLRGPGKAVAQWSKLEVFSEFLNPQKTVGGSISFKIFDTLDYAVILQYFADRSLKFYPDGPEWAKKLLVDACYINNDTKDFARQNSEFPVSATIWFLNPPWGNWQPNSDPPGNLNLNAQIAPNARKAAPNLKIGAYSNALYDDESDRYKYDKDQILKTVNGNLYYSNVRSDHEMRPAFFLRINDARVRKYLIDMHCARFKAWDLDFHYTDGPGFFHELPDYEAREVAQSYHWLDYLSSLRAKLSSIKYDAVIFSNRNMPYASINYLEWENELWKNTGKENWACQAIKLLAAKLERAPHVTMIPMYGHAEAEPMFSAYMVYYGNAAQMPMQWRQPYAVAAMRTREAKLMPGVIETPWYNQDSPTFEAMIFRMKNDIIINTLGHSRKETLVKLRFRAIDSGMIPGRRYNAELMTVAPCEPGKDNQGKIKMSGFDFPAQCPEMIELKIPSGYMTVSSLKISPAQ